MNKAFVREPDANEERCPRCGSQGLPVPEETLQSFLTLEQRRNLAQTASFCPLASCPVAYFDSLERSIPADQLARPIFPKNPAAPICPCFGLTTADIDQDLREGGVARTRAAVERARSPAADCRRNSPTGGPCVAEVQRYYMQHRGT